MEGEKETPLCRAVLMQFENTTNRSWWIIQTQPTGEGLAGC